MNWQILFRSSGTADWILLTAFHSLWISLAALLILRVRRLSPPAVRSTWCTFTLMLLLGLPLITWFVPRTAARVRPEPRASAAANATVAGSNEPLLNNLLGMKTPLPAAHITQWKVRMNQFGLLWLAVTLGCVGRLLYQLAFLRGYCNGLQEVEDDRIFTALQEINESFGFRKKPRFFVSHTLASPISMGMQTPLVILPASLYQSIGDGELRAILLHELAHIYHYDHVLGLLQGFIKALYWWNPLIYRLCSALTVAREAVSDNYAISGMQSAANYASLLVSLIEKTSLISRMPCTAGMATPYESLETRIKGIVSKERDMQVKTNKGTISAIAVTAILLCGIVSVGSQVKVFGIGQASSFADAKPVVVKIKNTGANFNLDRLNNSVLVLEAPDGTRYQSSPVLATGDTANCHFPEPIAPGQYKLILSIFRLSLGVIIPPTPDKAVTLEINLSNGISIRTPLLVRNERADIPQTDPIKLDASIQPVVLSRAELEYPEDARWAKISGIARVAVVVNEKGEVYEAKLLTGHPSFQQPALDAAIQWKFEPMHVNGEPRPFITTVTLSYDYQETEKGGMR